MKILIVDDEPLARERIVRLVNDIQGCEVIGEAKNGLEAIQIGNTKRPDVVLMDIRMPVMNGLEAAQHMASEDNPPAVIFTTAYDDHALSAFEAQAVDYLLKPIRQDRLEQALISAVRSTRAQKAAADIITQTTRTHISARISGNLTLVPIEDIYYFLADNKYVTVRHARGETLIDDSLKVLEEEFHLSLSRIHRNALVADQYLAGLEKTREGRHLLRFKNIDDHLEVSRRHLPALRKKLKRLARR